MLTESYKFSLEEDERMKCVREYLEALKQFFDESSSYLSTQIKTLADVLAGLILYFQLQRQFFLSFHPPSSPPKQSEQTAPRLK
ncbi:unnamed protein product [Dibothriocephalus latus]|uniref:Uncharacterized protein n=1 Tax=Dibothriocephalus latus TaxID=60516 RepID=A0A3P7RFQ4_DIBLA|nr:unnamed protein product [Dibothriocephalus latus]